MPKRNDRAETESIRFARLLDDFEQTGQSPDEFVRAHPDISSEDRALIRTAHSLARVESTPPDPDFRRNARIRLLNRTRASALAPEIPGAHANMKRERGPDPPLVIALKRILVGLAMLMGLFTLTGLGVVPMQNALPGDALYPGKLALENMQLLGTSPSEDAILSIRFASIRLTEIQLLIVQGRYRDVDAAVSAFEGNIDRAVLALANVAKENGTVTYPMLVKIENEMGHYKDTLQELLVFVPNETRPALARAIEASSIWAADSN